MRGLKQGLLFDFLCKQTHTVRYDTSDRIALEIKLDVHVLALHIKTHIINDLYAHISEMVEKKKEGHQLKCVKIRETCSVVHILMQGTRVRA